MSPQVLKATNTLRDFLFNKVYNVHAAEKEAERARQVVQLLYEYFNEHIDKLPPEYSFYSDEPERRVVDYIAGMTDQYALRLAEELPLTKGKAKQQIIKEEQRGETPPQLTLPLSFKGEGIKKAG